MSEIDNSSLRNRIYTKNKFALQFVFLSLRILMFADKFTTLKMFCQKNIVDIVELGLRLIALIFTLSLAVNNLSFAQATTQPNASTNPSPGEIYNKIREEQISAPAKILINKYAQLNLPAGLSFIPTKNAETLLNMMGSEGGPGLVGMVVDSLDPLMNWFIVIRDNQLGYVVDSDASKIDANKLLTKIRRELSASATQYAVAQGIKQQEIEDVSWIIPPTYDNAKKTLLWLLQTKIKAIDGVDSDPQGINLKTNMLYRYGFLQLNYASSINNIDAGKLFSNELIANIEFKNNSSYQDFNQSTDKQAPISVAQLVAGKAYGEETPKATNTLGSIRNDYRSNTWAVWFFMGILLIGVGFIAYDAARQYLNRSK